MIVVPAVPHVGAHFMRQLLVGTGHQIHLEHPYPGAATERIRDHLLAGHPCIMPLRHPIRVAHSWKRYGKDLEDYAGASFAQWWGVMGLVMPFDPYYLALDAPLVRDQQLANINNNLGLELATDWTPVRQEGAENLPDVIPVLNEAELRQVSAVSEVVGLAIDSTMAPGDVQVH